jgi:hypothetical protein
MHAHSGGCVEDVQQFWLDGPAYQHVRAKYPCVCRTATVDRTIQWVQSCLLSIVDCDQQDQLAHVHTDDCCRTHCVLVQDQLPHGSRIAVNSVRQIVEEDVELIRIEMLLSYG